MSRKNALILHDIRSVHNVGAIFRTAEAAGISKIYLSGITPGPLDRFGRPRSDFRKAALGAEKLVPWERISDLVSLLEALRKEKFYLIAIEQGGGDYRKVRSTERTAFLLGSETGGLSRDILSRCDAVAEIPMRGRKESLNVSVAAGVALFRMLDG